MCSSDLMRRTRTTKIGILLGQALPGHNETTVGSDGIGGDGRGIRLIRRRRFRLLRNRSGESRKRNSQYQGGEWAKQAHGRTSLSAVVSIGMPLSWLANSFQHSIKSASEKLSQSRRVSISTATRSLPNLLISFTITVDTLFSSTAFIIF